MIGSKELPVAYSLPSRNSSRGLRKIGLEVFLGERFWAFRDSILELLAKCYPQVTSRNRCACHRIFYRSSGQLMCHKNGDYPSHTNIPVGSHNWGKYSKTKPNHFEVGKDKQVIIPLAQASWHITDKLIEIFLVQLK